MGITVFTIIDENNMFCFSRVIPYIVLQRSSALDGGLSFLRRRTSAYTLAAPPEAAHRMRSILREGVSLCYR